MGKVAENDLYQEGVGTAMRDSAVRHAQLTNVGAALRRECDRHSQTASETRLIKFGLVCQTGHSNVLFPPDCGKHNQPAAE